jgi:hypothetical protein
VLARFTPFHDWIDALLQNGEKSWIRLIVKNCIINYKYARYEGEIGLFE